MIKHYLFWDTERIRNTKIYMLAYILTDCDFNVLRSEILIDSSIDVSKRHSPRRKVEALKAQANILTSFNSFAKYFLNILCDEDTIGVCFGTEDYTALNDQLKIHNCPIVEGQFFDVEDIVKKHSLALPSNLTNIAKYLGVQHDPHNPLSDSSVTMTAFRHIAMEKGISIEDISKIPNKTKILDITVNPSNTQ